MTSRTRLAMVAGAALAGIALIAVALIKIDPFFAWRTPTFSRDVAPILFENCVSCHRPSGMAPFSLLAFDPARKHAKQISEVTTSRFMPPWLPRDGPRFAGERHLTPKQIRTLQRWAIAGAPPGNLSRLPRPPSFPEGWFLGKPDLVISMPVPFDLPAEGRDLYRNFVIPIPLEHRKFVRAVEFKAADPRVIHHAFLYVDATGDARRLDLKDASPGFEGMNPGRGAGSPGGHFLSWQPGTVPAPEPAGTQWALEPGNDAVLQMHMRPSGKPERVTAEVGFYFTEAPPTRFPLRLLLRSTAIDIPPGEKNYVIESSYRLPVAIQILAVLPHAHYLGHHLEAWAELADGARKTILNIPEWDFDWQDHYQFAQPLALPKGATLRMRYTYDNSAANPRNADTELRRVQFGEQTSDEMGELWLQVLTTNPAERSTLEADYVRNWAVPDTIARARLLLERNPDDAETRANLGAVLVMTGQLDAALVELKRALQSDPESARAHSHLGQIYLQRQDAIAARREFEKVLELDPDDFKARNNLGYLLLVTGDPSAAAAHFERVLAQHPEEALARKNLERARAMMRGR